MKSTSKPKFQYLITPGQVQANSRVNFTLTVSNPNTEVSLAVCGGTPANTLNGLKQRTNDAIGDEMDLFFKLGNEPDDLAPNLDSVTPTSLSEGWQIAKVPSSDGPFFKIFPTGSGEIPPGGSIQFLISNVLINPLPGGSLAQVFEFVGGDEAIYNQTLIKTAQELSITAELLPPTVGLDQPTKLQWTVTGGAFVTIQPLGITRPVQGGAFTDSIMVTPQPRQTIYTLTVFTPDQQSRNVIVVATVSPPIFRFFTPKDQAPITIDEHVELAWNVDYSTRLFLTTPDPVRVQANAKRTVEPKALLLGNESQVDYILQAEGYEGPVRDQVTIPFQPARVLYYRYITTERKSTEFKAVNALRIEEKTVGELSTLTVTGPGGPIVRHLGPGPFLEIPIFLASQNPIKAGEKTTLSWETQNAEKLVLDPGSRVIPADQIAKGSTEVSPPETTTYVLIATGADGEITSQITIVVEPASVEPVSHECTCD